MLERFKELRTLQGRTQVDMAVLIGVSPSIIHAFERGLPKRLARFSPRIKSKLAYGYGVPIEEINAVCADENAAAAA